MRNKISKKIAKVILSLGMSLIMMLLIPAQILATEKPKEYISEIKMCVKSNADEAKKELEAKGYTVCENDLNKDAGGKEKKVVYLGYKTTKDKNKAITDMKIMDMDGGYSLSDYQKGLQTRRDDLENDVNDLKILIKAYQKRYAEKSEVAIEVHDEMNRFVEDDSKTKMGDYFLKDNLSYEDLNKILLQSSSYIVKILKDDLVIASRDSKSNDWVNDLSKLGLNEEIMYNSGREYSNAANDILSGWKEVSENLRYFMSIIKKCKYKKGSKGIYVNTEKLHKKIESLSENNLLLYTNGENIYNIIRSKTNDGETVKLADKEGIEYMEDIYNSDSLLNFFAMDMESDDFQINMLYPFASLLTETQLAFIRQVGLNDFIVSNNAGIKNIKQSEVKEEEFYKTVNKKLDEGEYIDNTTSELSIYAGVDRRAFCDGGVALTNEAQVLNARTGMSPYVEALMIKESVILLAGAALATLLWFTGTAALKVQIANAAAADTIMLAHSASMCAVEEEFWVYSNTNIVSSFLANQHSFCTAKFYISGNALHAFAIGIVLIVAGIFVGKLIYNYYNREFSEIPELMVDEREDSNGNMGFVYYEIVKDTEGNKNDLNAFKGKKWNALYTTKDDTAGDPITTDIMVKYGDNRVNSGYSAVSHFSEKGAYDLNSNCFESDDNSIYMSFKRDISLNHDASDTASVFGNVQVLSMVSISGFVGLTLGCMSVYAIETRKRRSVKEGGEKI